MINYHDLPISDEIKSFIREWLPYQNEGPAMELPSIIADMEFANPYEHGLIRHLETLYGVIYEYCDGFEFDGESYTPGLDGSDDGSFERHIEIVVTQSIQQHVNLLNDLFNRQRPNRLFPNV